MGDAKRYSDMKTLFFIFNSFIVILGLQLFSSGVGNLVLKSTEAVDTINIVVGLFYIVIALVAFVAASAESKKLLRAYTTVMTVRSILNVTWLVMWDGFDASGAAAGRRGSQEELYAALIVETIITMVSLLLCFTLTVQQEISAYVAATVVDQGVPLEAFTKAPRVSSA